MPFSPDLLYGWLQENSSGGTSQIQGLLCLRTKNSYISDNIDGNNAVQGYKTSNGNLA